MKFSETFIPTLREEPAHAEVISHILLLRAGFIRQLGSGLFTWLPLGLRVLKKIEQVIREELIRYGCQEMLMPFVQPSELWKQSQRWETMGMELLRLQDRHENDYCLSPTHEEVVTDLFRDNFMSYRQLPCNLFHFSTKFRDEIRPRFGVLRSREFIMKDGYSFHMHDKSLDVTYQEMYDAYSAILTRFGVNFRVVEADPGVIGDGESHEFHVIAGSGEDTLAYSKHSNYAANIESAEALPLGKRATPTMPLQKVPTPDVRTIEDLTKFLNLPIERTVKTLIVHGQESLVALILRGDHELNLVKAAKIREVSQPVTFASEEVIFAELGCSVGSLGPIKLKIPFYVDRSAAMVSDFSFGANEEGKHFIGANWDRDVECANVVDLRMVGEGDPAVDGSGPLAIQRGIEVGHIFKLGTKYTRSMEATVLDREGNSIYPTMGCYGIGVTRMAAAVVEQCHSAAGIDWPIEIAPMQVHLIGLFAKSNSKVKDTVDRLYQALCDAGIEILYDDREERPGVKFADADLIGIPHRIVVGERSLNKNTVEYRLRQAESENIPLDEIVTKILNFLNKK